MRHRRPSDLRIKQADRPPVSDYEAAVRRLVQVRCDVSLSDDAYETAVQIVADVFWVTDKRLRRDVRVASQQLGVA